MSLFLTHIIVDWPACSKPSPAKPSEHAIWWAAARDGRVQAPEYARTRHEAINRLAAVMATELAANRRVLVGFDFPFGYPGATCASQCAHKGLVYLQRNGSASDDMNAPLIPRSQSLGDRTVLRTPDTCGRRDFFAPSR